MKSKRAAKRYRSLHEWLDRTGTPQYVLAKMAGLKASHLSMILRGSRRCSLERAIVLSRVTGVAVENLTEWPKRHALRKIEKIAKDAA